MSAVRWARRSLGFAFSLFLVLCPLPSVSAGAEIKAARLWPAQDYTRITLESDAPIRHKVMTLQDPERLVIDLEEADAGVELRELPAKVSADDPYVQAVRIGRPEPGVLRVVLDLKGKIIPQVFALKPVGDYGHRLVVDVYPSSPADPLMALYLGKTLGPDPQHPPAAAGPGGSSAPPDTGVEHSRKPAIPSGKKRDDGLARQVIIAIDAGHGGEDPGARGRRGTREKDITLAIARRLRAKIDADEGMKAVMVRDGDYFIPLNVRVEKARRAQADLFVSIHADAWIKPHVRGSSVFALSERGATSAMARWIAKTENDADLIGGVNFDVDDPYLKKTLLDLSQTATINDSLRIGRDVLGQLGGINELHKDEVEQAGFAVLKAPDIPSILVETAFISNPQEEKRLRDLAYQDKMAEAIYRGIKRYFARNPPIARSKLAQNTD